MLFIFLVVLHVERRHVLEDYGKGRTKRRSHPRRRG